MTDKRQKYQTRAIILYDTSRDVALAMVRNAPDGVEVIAREPVKARGLDANGYYFMRLGEIAKQAWFAGRQFNTDVWHEHCKREIMPDTVTTKDGIERSKWIEMPTGLPTVISTTQLDKKCFSEYTSEVEAFGASLGVMFSANQRSY